jgi:MraZ protein
MLSMFFLGQHHCTIRSENRLPLPAGFRERLSGGAYVTQGFDRNLWVLPAQAFEAISQRLSTMNLADPQARLLLRMILGAACELEVDEAGGMSLPQNLRAFANLQGEAVLVGQGGYFEVWSQAGWREQEAQLQDTEANARRFAALDLAMA